MLGGRLTEGEIMYANRIIAGILFGLVTWAADADPITFNFTGTVTVGDGIYASTAGMPVTGSYTFDTDLLVTSPSDAFFNQFRNNSPAANQALTNVFDMTVTVGAITRSSSDNVSTPSIFSHRVYWGDDSTIDQFQFQSIRRASTDDEALLFLFDLDPSPPNAVSVGSGSLTTDMPLTTAPNVSLFSNQFNSYIYYDSQTGQWVGQVMFTIETITAAVIPPAEVVTEISDDLREIIDDPLSAPELAERLEDANIKLETAFDELAKDPPDNQAAVGNIQGAVGNLPRRNAERPRLAATLGLRPRSELDLHDRPALERAGRGALDPHRPRSGKRRSRHHP